MTAGAEREPEQVDACAGHGLAPGPR